MNDHVQESHAHFIDFVSAGCTIVTPAMAAGVSDRLWEMGDVVKLKGFEAKRIETQKFAALAPAGAW